MLLNWWFMSCHFIPLVVLTCVWFLCSFQAQLHPTQHSIGSYESSTDESSSDDEEMWEALLDDDEVLLLAGLRDYAMHLDKYCNRRSYKKPKMTGLEWVQENLADSTCCYKMFRMRRTHFYQLHDLLVQSYGLASSTKSTSIEALGMFLWMLGAPQSVWQAHNRMARSSGTIHNLFAKVLTCVVKLAEDIIKTTDPQFSTIHPRLLQPRFYPYFNGCIGAIDGTHIKCLVPNSKLVQYMCRKGMTTQNVMAVCDFDMKFTFVLAGWPGSVHDMRVFNDAVTRFGHVFPHPPPGNLVVAYLMLCSSSYIRVP